MNVFLYHERFGIPNNGCHRACYNGLLKYTKHALNAAFNDRYGKINLPTHFRGNGKLIEVEAEGIDFRNPRYVVKQVWQLDYNEHYNLSIVIQPDGKVRTVWLNKKQDNHVTLKEERYVKL